MSDLMFTEAPNDSNKMDMTNNDAPGSSTVNTGNAVPGSSTAKAGTNRNSRQVGFNLDSSLAQMTAITPGTQGSEDDWNEEVDNLNEDIFDYGTGGTTNFEGIDDHDPEDISIYFWQAKRCSCGECCLQHLLFQCKLKQLC